MEQKRDRSFDIAKGIAIFLVIWGHVIQHGNISHAQDNLIFRIIYSVHMPLFVVISGYFFYHSAQKRNFKELAVPKVLNYLKLLLVWNTVHFTFEIIIGNKKVVSFVEGLKLWWNEMTLGYWFLWAILLYSVIGALVLKKLQQKFWVAGFVLGACICMVNSCRWVILALYPFFMAGIIIAHKNLLSILRKKSVCIICAIIYLVGCVICVCENYLSNAQLKIVIDSSIQIMRGNLNWGMWIREVFRLGLYYVLGIVGSVCLLNLSSWTINNKMMQRNIAAVLIKLGGESLAIYILQRIVVEQLYPWGCKRIFGDGLFLTNTVWNNVLMLFVACLFTIVIFWGVHVIKKNSVGKFLIANR